MGDRYQWIRAKLGTCSKCKRDMNYGELMDSLRIGNDVRLCAKCLGKLEAQFGRWKSATAQASSKGLFNG